MFCFLRRVPGSSRSTRVLICMGEVTLQNFSFFSFLGSTRPQGEIRSHPGAQRSATPLPSPSSLGGPTGQSYPPLADPSNPPPHKNNTRGRKGGVQREGNCKAQAVLRLFLPVTSYLFLSLSLSLVMKAWEGAGRLGRRPQAGAEVEPVKTGGRRRRAPLGSPRLAGWLEEML